MQFNSRASLFANRGASDVAAQQHRSVAVELNKGIRKVQQMPGCGHLLSALSIEQMQASAIDGIINIVNIGTLRSDAIINSLDDIRTIPLSNPSASTADEWTTNN